VPATPDDASVPLPRNSVPVPHPLPDPLVELVAGLTRRSLGEVELKTFAKFPASLAQFSKNGAPYEMGETLKQPDLARTLEVHVDELFEATPVDGETYPIRGHEIDLEQLIRDAVLLELPLAPHCERPCDPTPTGDDADLDDLPADPRWAVLSELEI